MGLGGGNDGGVIATKRGYFIKLRQAQEKADPVEIAAVKWAACALSGEPLSVPVAADELGHLYNYKAVVTALAEKSMPKAFSHIKKMKNVTKLKLVPNVAAPTAEESKADASSGASYWTGITKGQWMCPVTREETNGKVPFVFLRTCGCVFADKALREVKSSTCMSCGKDFAPDDVIKLCPLPDEEAAMRTRMVERRRAAKAAKRSAGTGAGATAGGAGGEPSVGAAADAGSSALASRRKREDGGSREDRKAKRARDAASASTWRPMAATANGAGAAAPSTTSAAVAAMVARADASLKKKRGASESFSSLFAAPETKAPSSAGLFIRTAAPAFSQKRGVD